MAAKNDTNVYDFVHDGTVFTYDRLAEDVLYHLYSVFAVQKRLIPPFRCSENHYKKENTIHFVSRQCKVFQIKLRSNTFDAFTSSNAVKRIGNDITDLYKYFSEHFQKIRYFIAQEMKSFSSINKFYLSFALLAELALFCILKNKPKVIKKTAKTWVSFFQNNLMKEFEDDGGISEVLRRAEKTWYLYEFLLNFIPSHCVPYEGQKLCDLFVEELQNSSFKQVKVGNSVAWISMSDSLLDMDAEEFATNEEMVKAFEEILNPLLSVPYHDRLGVPLQEEVVKHSFHPKMMAQQAEAASIDSYEVALKATSELSLKEEHKKSRKLRLSEASVLNHKRSVSNVDIFSATDAKEPETKSYDRLPASHEPTRNDLVDLLPQVPKPPEPFRVYVENLQSASENTTDN